MKPPANPLPQLESPGKGLPWREAMMGKYVIFPVLKTALSWDRALEHFESEGHKVLTLVNSVPPDALFRPVLIPRVTGIEDSSRFWSMAMTLQHLLIVGEIIADFIIKLSHGEAVTNTLDIATVKPAKDQSPRIVADYEAFLGNFRTLLEKQVGDKHSSACCVHPWFGCLNPHQWLVMSTFHQFIHRRQIHQIIKHL